MLFSVYSAINLILAKASCNSLDVTNFSEIPYELLGDFICILADFDKHGVMVDNLFLVECLLLSFGILLLNLNFLI